MVLEDSVDVGGRGRLEGGRRGVGAGIFAFGIASNASAGVHVNELFVVVGMLTHVIDDTRANGGVFILVTIQLVGQCVEEAVACTRVVLVEAIQVLHWSMACPYRLRVCQLRKVPVTKVKETPFASLRVGSEAVRAGLTVSGMHSTPVAAQLRVRASDLGAEWRVGGVVVEELEGGFLLELPLAARVAGARRKDQLRQKDKAQEGIRNWPGQTYTPWKSDVLPPAATAAPAPAVKRSGCRDAVCNRPESRAASSVRCCCCCWRIVSWACELLRIAPQAHRARSHLESWTASGTPDDVQAYRRREKSEMKGK